MPCPSDELLELTQQFIYLGGKQTVETTEVVSQSDLINWIVISMYLCSITASKGVGCKGRMDGWMDGLMD